MKKIYFLLLASSMFLASCKKDEAIEASVIEPQYVLPQGNNSYDADMVSFYNRFNAYFLYKFTTVDFGWQPAVPSSNSNGLSSTYTVTNADGAYIDKVLAFTKNNWLNYYPDNFLKLVLPYKVLLAKNIIRIATNTPINTVTGYNHITIGNFGSEFDAMTAAQKTTFKADIHNEMWNFALVGGRAFPPTGFSSVSNYAQTGVTTANMYQYGFIALPSGDNKTNKDMLDFIRAIVSNTKAQLDATILSGTTDSKGLVKQKYNALIDYYKTTYNLDLQAIGNAGLIQ